MKKIYTLIIFVSCLFPDWARGQCSTATTVPYFEGFEGITQTNELPMCWTANNPSVTCLTFTSGGAGSGSKMAGFYYTPSMINHFYSGLIHLDAGVTYSANVFCKTSGGGSSISWANLKLSVGPNQSTVGLSQIAAINGNVVLPTYSSLSNTFVVASTGDYYMAVSATGLGSGNSFYLYFDDLSVTIPCGMSNNSPTVSIAVSNNPVCMNELITYTVSGADSYSTSVGTGTSANTVYTLNMLASAGLTVFGTSTLTGCSSPATVIFTVYPSPTVFAYGSKPSICVGESVNLSATGSAASYVWSYNQLNTQNIVVSPTVTTVYTVTGFSTGNCSSQAIYTVVVNPSPSFTVTSDPVQYQICYGRPSTITATGNFSSCQWISNTGMVLSGNPVVVTLTNAVTFTATVTDANGCHSDLPFTMSGMVCGLGLIENPDDDSYKLYPNPFNDQFRIDSEDASAKQIEISDISGRIIQVLTSTQTQTIVDLAAYHNGIYFVRIHTDNTRKVLRVVKN
ncbi:MAG: T9SS type A sorting domain-containing protein [Bacteroidia bacterium]|nr:T9SS type A sorting domain-containing protein [Bacteroidia bacterium]